MLYIYAQTNQAYQYYSVSDSALININIRLA